MEKITRYWILCLLLLIAGTGQAQDLKKVAQTGLQFLKVDLSARPAAMGGAYTMVGDDASAMFYNPAGMAHMTSGTNIFATRTNWIADIAYTAGAASKTIGNIGTFGVNFISCDYGEIIGTRVSSDVSGFEETGNVDVGAYALGVSYARRLSNKFTIGGQVKYAYQHLGESTLSEDETVTNEVGGVAFDFGTMFYPGFRSFRLGMSVRNFSQQFKYAEEGFQLPLTFRIGFAMDVLDLVGDHNNSFVLALDAIHPRDYTERIHVGGEYWWMNMLALRAGYKTNYDEESLSFGFGFRQAFSGINLKIDYAYSPMDRFSNVNRFTIGASF
ncbi:MAG TPA: PorV/PorQ family protein [bacterium]|nr:PorV/PorQ family protein [bacterium]